MRYNNLTRQFSNKQKSQQTRYKTNLTHHQGFRPSLCAIHERPLPKFPANTQIIVTQLRTFLNIAKIFATFVPVSSYQSLHLSHFHPQWVEPCIEMIIILFFVKKKHLY